MTTIDSERPQRNRRRYQEAQRRRRRRQRRRRRARVARIRFLRTLRSFRFWSRTMLGMLVLLSVAFWAKFALVYNVPADLQQNSLDNVAAYVAVKPWWFGPPVFNLDAYPDSGASEDVFGPYAVMIIDLGRYADIVEHPHFVWVQRADGRP